MHIHLKKLTSNKYSKPCPTAFSKSVTIANLHTKHHRPDLLLSLVFLSNPNTFTYPRHRSFPTNITNIGRLSISDVPNRSLNGERERLQ